MAADCRLAHRRGYRDGLGMGLVKEIGTDQVTYRDADGRDHTLPNDQVFVFAGGELPTKFLQSAGVMIDTKFGEA